jgi:hypothetical protein
MNRGLGSSIAAALASVLLAFGLAGTGAHAATSLVTSPSGIRADGKIDWGDKGPEFTTVSNHFTIAVHGVSGLEVTVSQVSGSFTRLDQSSPGSWPGNFTPGDKLLSTKTTVSATGPVSLVFNSPVQGVGAQIQAFSTGAFTASIEAFNSSNASLGSFTLAGDSNAKADNSAIFIGILSNAVDISKVVFGVPVATANAQDFLINGPRIQVAPVPEPKTYTMLMAGLGLLGLIARRRRKSLNAAA